MKCFLCLLVWSAGFQPLAFAQEEDSLEKNIIEKPSSEEQKIKIAKKSAYDVMKGVYAEINKHPDKEFDVTMQIIEASNKKENKEKIRAERHFTLKSKKEGENKYNFINIYHPPYIKGTKMLSNKSSKTKEQKIYFPSFNQTLSIITQEDMGKSFMGSDFSNEDMSGRDLESDNYEFFTVENPSEEHYYVKATPKVPGSSSYSKILYKINKKVRVIEEGKFYNLKGEHLKTLSVQSVKKVQESYIVNHSVMKNHTKNRKTKMINQKIKIIDNIPISEFSLQSLQK